jgi:hypothetical protein
MSKNYLPAIACALMPLLIYIVIRPFAEIGIIDDWSYIKTAQVLAQTGHIVYNGWATAMLGWQLYFGALFVKVFGFSFTVVRFATVIESMAAAFLLQRTFVRASLNSWNATLATMAFILSPLCISLEFTFLTDISGILCLVVCLYMCLRALEAESERSAILWISLAALLNAAGGTARQIAWLGVLVMVPSTLWLLRKKQRVLMAGSLSCVAGACIVAAAMTWFARQPYTIQESLIPSGIDSASARVAAGYGLRSVGQLMVMVLPVLLMFAGTLRLWNRRMLALSMAALCCLAVPLIARLLAGRIHVTFAFFLDDFQVAPAFERLNVIVSRGMHLSIAPDVLRMLLIGAVALGIFGLFICFFADAHHRLAPQPSASTTTWRQLGVVLGPFSVAYIGLLVPRATQMFFSDRYLVPLFAIFLLVLARFYQERVKPNLSLLCVLFIAVFGGFGAAATHDMFAQYRGYVSAINKIQSTGTPATAILGPWEFEAWTQVEKVGYINNISIQIPKGAWALPPTRSLPANCDTSSSYFLDWTPAIKPVYVIVLDPTQCGAQLVLQPVMYTTWIAPYVNSIYTVKLPATSPN